MSECPAPRHGTATAYQVDRCRCPDASEAQRLYRKRLRLAHHRGQAVRVPVIGLQRRLEALMAMGWPRHEISRRMGYTPHSNMWLGRRDGVLRSTYAKVTAVYDELSMIPGPSRWTRSFALSRGYAPPLAWSEESIDDPAAQPCGLLSSQKGIKGTPGTPITWDDLRWADVELLRGAGEEDAQIAARFGITVMALHKAERRRTPVRSAA